MRLVVRAYTVTQNRLLFPSPVIRRKTESCTSPAVELESNHRIHAYPHSRKSVSVCVCFVAAAFLRHLTRSRTYVSILCDDNGSAEETPCIRVRHLLFFTREGLSLNSLARSPRVREQNGVTGRKPVAHHRKSCAVLRVSMRCVSCGRGRSPGNDEDNNRC